MSKKSSDKNSKSKSANSEKGSLAFVNNGLLKSGFVRFFWSADVEPTSTAKEYVEHYGPSVKCRYVKCTDPETALEKLLKECGDKVVVGNLVEYGPKLAMDALKEASGAKQTHVCDLQDKKQKDKKSKKSKKDDSDEENEDEEEEDNEDEEDDGKKACSDDEVSDAPASDDDEEEEEKPKKNSKKDSKDEEDEEEKPKKNSKKEAKGTKSTKNSKKK